MLFMYSSVAVSLGVVAPFAASLYHSHQYGLLPPNEEYRHLQPRVHQMRPSDTPVIKERIHRNLPEPRQLGLALARIRHRQAVVSHPVVQSIRPEGVGAGVGDGDRCGGAGIVCEADGGETLEGVDRVVEEGCTEAFDGAQWNSGEGVESDEIAVDFVLGWVALMCHSV